MTNSGKIAGVDSIDFERETFGAVNIMEGRKTFPIWEVCSAAEKAMEKPYQSFEDRFRDFIERLNGTEEQDAFGMKME